LRPRAWLGGGFIALLAFAVWLGAGTGAGKAAAGECPNEAIRIAQSATHLPNCRAYERVSPQDTSGGVVGVDTQNQPMFGAARADGNAMTFGSSSAFPGAERGALRTFNLAHRSATGWSSFGILTTTEPSVPMDLTMSPAWPTPSTDMTRMMFVAERSLGPPNPITANGSVYRSAPQGQGPPTWLSRWDAEGTQPEGYTGFALPLGGSPDYSSGYFRYSTPLSSIAGDNLRTGKFGLYYFEGSQIVPAAVLPSGTVSPQGAVPAGTSALYGIGGPGGILPELERNQVSADGSKLFFISPAEGPDPKQLYVGEGGKPARLISRDIAGNAAASGVTTLSGASGETTVSTGTRGRETSFAEATDDGSRVVFRSEATLTADAPTEGVKTYRAEISAGSISLEYLPAVTGNPLRIDADASTIVFAIGDEVANTSSYYVWDEDRPGLPYEVVTDLSNDTLSTHMIEPAFSTDGETLVFTSGAEVEPGVVPLAETNYVQIYRWTQQSETAECISCRRDGGTPARFGGRVSAFLGLPTDNPAFPEGGQPDIFNQSSVVANRKISSDGRRVFFDTSDPLVPARDVNGTRDVYMWEDGQVHLLTSGRRPVHSLILDNSESGDDLLMITKDDLVPSDTNETYDVYDVRVNGGFDESVEAGCAGDACQPQSAAGARPAATPASRSIRGAGNQGRVQLGSLRVAQLGKPGGVARVRIKVPASGRLKLAGNLIENKARGVRSKGSVTLGVALNKAGKRKLARNGQLRTKVKVTFRDGDGQSKQRSTTLRFKQGGAR
jgi:hypothetical protein